MATFRATASSLLNTIGTSADVLTQTISTVAVGIDMANKWATNEQKKQAATLKYEPAIVDKEAKHKATMRLAELNMEAAKYAAKDEAHEQAYEEAEAELTKFLEDNK